MKAFQEVIEKNKFLILFTLIISLIHIIYAAITLRGSYMDGTMFQMFVVNSLANGEPSFPIDAEHTRSVIMILQELPIMIAYMFGVRNPYWLYFVFSFWLFFCPLLLLFANWKLTQRTKRTDLFAISVFAFFVFIIPYSIVAVVEVTMAVLLHLILFNYLVSTIDYTKKDIGIILFLLITLFGGTEYVLFIGPIIFAAGLYYGLREKNPINKKVKITIGITGLFAAIFVFIAFLTHTTMIPDGIRFFEEAFDYFNSILKLNSVLSILALTLLFLFGIKKNYFSIWYKTAFFTLFFILFIYMMRHLTIYLIPMLEGHMRTLPFWLMPIILSLIFLLDIFKRKPTEVFYTNLLTISLICGIFHTAWQINNTYWFNKNIEYMKETIKKAPPGLYFIGDNNQISSFYNKDLRRYLWNYDYTANSIAFSPEYKVKTILIPVESANVSERAGNPTFAYMYNIKNDTITIPRITIQIKNRYWDLTGILKEMEAYIATDPQDHFDE